jgi:hypothetical protein
MKERLSAVPWKKVSIAIGVGLVLSLAASTIYTKSRMKDDLSCVQIFPDGSEKTFYGADCYPPHLLPSEVAMNH